MIIFCLDVMYIWCHHLYHGEISADQVKFWTLLSCLCSILSILVFVVLFSLCLCKNMSVWVFVVVFTLSLHNPHWHLSAYFLSLFLHTLLLVHKQKSVWLFENSNNENRNGYVCIISTSEMYKDLLLRVFIVIVIGLRMYTVQRDRKLPNILNAC